MISPPEFAAVSSTGDGGGAVEVTSASANIGQPTNQERVNGEDQIVRDVWEDPRQRFFNGNLPSFEAVLGAQGAPQGHGEDAILLLFQTQPFCFGQPIAPGGGSAATLIGKESQIVDQSTSPSLPLTNSDGHMVVVPMSYDDRVDALFAGNGFPEDSIPQSLPPPQLPSPPVGIPLTAVLAEGTVPLHIPVALSSTDPDIDRLVKNAIEQAITTTGILNTSSSSGTPASQSPWMVPHDQISTSGEHLAPDYDPDQLGSNFEPPHCGGPLRPTKTPTLDNPNPHPPKTPLFLPADNTPPAPTGLCLHQSGPTGVQQSDNTAFQEMNDLLETSAFQDDNEDSAGFKTSEQCWAEVGGEQYEIIYSAFQQVHTGYPEMQARPPTKKRKADPELDQMLRQYVAEESDPRDTLVVATPPHETRRKDVRDSTSHLSNSKWAKGKFKVPSGSSGKPRKVSEWGFQGLIPEDDRDWITELGVQDQSTRSGSSKHGREHGFLSRNPASGIGLKAHTIDKGKKSAISTTQTWDPHFSRHQIGESSKTAAEKMEEGPRVKHDLSFQTRVERKGSAHRPSSGSSNIKNATTAFHAPKDDQIPHFRPHEHRKRRLERREGQSDLRREFKRGEVGGRTGYERSQQSWASIHPRGASTEETQQRPILIQPFSSKPALRIPGSTLHLHRRNRDPFAPISSRRFEALSLQDDEVGSSDHRKHGHVFSSRHRRRDEVRQGSPHAAHPPHERDSRRRRVRRHTMWSNEIDQGDAETVDLTHLD